MILELIAPSITEHSRQGGAVRYRQQSLQRGFTSTPGNPKPSLKGISFTCKYVSAMVEVELVNGKMFIPIFHATFV